MTETGPAAAKTWRYRFTRPDGEEIEVGEFTGDEAAETRARTISKAEDSPVVIGRHDHVVRFGTRVYNSIVATPQNLLESPQAPVAQLDRASAF